MAWTFPNIDPVAVAVGPFLIRWYALAYLAGILLGWVYARYIAAKDPMARPNRDDIDDFIPFVVLGIILGGRLGYVLFYQPAYFFANPGEVLQLWHGGMSFHGGASGVIIACIAYCLIKKIPILRMGDLAALCCTIGLFFGRIANFINGELFGRVTTHPIGMVFPHGGPDPRHPSQLYEAALEGVLLFVILSLLAHKESIRSKPGIITGAFLMGYGLCRMVVEMFRQPDEQLGFVLGSFTMGQLLCVPMIVAGAGFIAYALYNGRKLVRAA